MGALEVADLARVHGLVTTTRPRAVLSRASSTLTVLSNGNDIVALPAAKLEGAAECRRSPAL